MSLRWFVHHITDCSAQSGLWFFPFCDYETCFSPSHLSTPLLPIWKSHATLFQPVSFFSPFIPGQSYSFYVQHSFIQLFLDILYVANPLLEAKCTVYRDEQHTYCLPRAHWSLPGYLGKQLDVQGGDNSNSGQRPVETQRKVGIFLSRSQENHQWWNNTRWRVFWANVGQREEGM